jgi:TNF receptor-associated protein 1
LADYVERKKEDQKEIYYLISPTRQWAEESPYFEPMRKKGMEVLFMLGDSTDEFVVENLKEYQGMKLVSLESGDVETSAEKKETTADTQGIVELFKRTLGKSVSDVKVIASKL